MAIFSVKVEVKVTRLLTLVSLERVSLVEYVCHKYEVSISYGSKIMAKLKVVVFGHRVHIFICVVALNFMSVYREVRP